MRSLTSQGRERAILAALSNGKNTYMRMDRLESSSFDSSWIEVIEGVIFDLGEIIANPRQNTKTEGSIVPVELARKTGAESVQHLASHTQYVKEIDEYGNVIPSKVLTMAYEDDIRTYENRFIATFVRRLILFIEKRYEFVSKFAELHDESVLMIKNKSIVEGAEVEIETKIRINHKSDDELSLKSNEYVERIKQMRQYILYFYSSDFMKKLKTEKDVHNPIIQTNIIRKNPLYHHCYEVYRFIERYEHLGVKYKVDEHYSLFDDKELQEINRTLFANYITLKGKERSANAKSGSKVYKPKILTSIDDESFIYGPLFEGPIEFVRVDEGYQKYLDSKIRKDLPLHPTKKEKEYYADEYAAKAENKEDLKQKNDLLRRKEKEVAAFNKAAAKIDQEREAARLALLEQEKQIIRKEEDDLLARARSEIVEQSKKEQFEADKEFLQSELAAVKVVEASHPYSEPVTYDEAALQIWPQIANAPALRVGGDEEPVVAKQEEPAPVVEEAPAVEEQPVEEVPVVEEAPIEEAPAEQPVEEEKPQVKPVPQPVEEQYPHHDARVLTYDEAALEVWPQLANAPKAVKKVPAKKAKPVKVEPVKATPVKEQPVVEQPVAQEEAKPAPKAKKVAKAEPKPADVPEYQHPYSKPVTYDEAALEIWPNLADAPILRVAPKEEEPVPVVEEKKPAPAKKAAPAKKPAVKKKQPKVEPQPVVKEEPKEEKKAPAKKAAPKKEAPKTKPVKEEKPAPVKKVRVKEVPVTDDSHEKEVPVRVVEKPREKIPGRFIVKLMGGYYVNENKLSPFKEDAKVFDDFNLAKDIKKERGGKIIKL